MSKEITKEMLFNYFANKATAIQKKRIDEWAREADNREMFYECLTEWESENLQYVSDTEAAIRRHQRRLSLDHTQELVTNNSIGLRRLFVRLSVAATVLIGLGITGYLSRDQWLFKTLTTTYGETKSILLDDGTKVALNANSTLTIPRFGFGNYTRNVSLKGEADFSVAHMPGDQKFVVKTSDGPDIIVLGTEFTVYTRLNRFKVALSKGRIQLNYKDTVRNKNLIMRPGDLVTINAKGKAVLAKTPDPRVYSAWKDSRYVFDHTSLQDIGILFKDDFGLEIVVADPEISTWSVSGTFKASNGEELLEALAEASGLVYNKENQRVIIYSAKNKTK
ncbi:hypothetical protein WSM22_25650 [Cytophagales bacterium WSM2-2]|nr:hypothetical protein WSM22_25650 [Cytophagales bacterium WSM2-2]